MTEQRKTHKWVRWGNWRRNQEGKAPVRTAFCEDCGIVHKQYPPTSFRGRDRYPVNTYRAGGDTEEHHSKYVPPCVGPWVPVHMDGFVIDKAPGESQPFSTGKNSEPESK